MRFRDVEAALSEPTDFMQRWCEFCCNPLMNMKIRHLGLLILMIVAPTVIYVSWPSNDSKETANIPDSELQNLAAYYMKSLDENTHPCEDFYTFACGNLKKEYRKENEDLLDTMDMMNIRVRASLDEFLTKPVSTSDSATLRQMKIFHQMCINKTKTETEGIESVLAVLNEIGGWPLLTENESENNESWEQIVGSVNRAGFVTFFPYFLNFVTNSKYSYDVVVLLEPLVSSRHPRELWDDYQMVDYVKLVALLLNATNDRIDDDIKSCIDFESELQKLTDSAASNVEIHTLKSLIRTYPEMPWKTFFRNVFVSTGLEISSNETVFLSHVKYSVQVSKLLNKTSARIIRNYVVWRLIEEAILLMPEKFREAKNAFEQLPVGQSRNLDCVDALIKKARVSIGYLYTKHLFDGLAKNKSHDMIKSIKSQGYQFLKNISWMDDVTKTKLIETLRNSGMMVPHPDDNIDVMETFEFQSNDTFFANYRRLSEAHRNFEYGRLRMSREVSRQLMPFESAMIANAWYSSSMNTSIMQAAIFQRPIFSASQPMYLNYGGIGFIIAHEMTHAMQLLSVCGNETCPSFIRFQERKGCMENLYEGYVLKQLNETVNGKKTAGENIGDLIGLTLSYRAYEEFAKDSEEQLLPGLNYTARQWFWINTATSFCIHESDEALIDTITTDPHSPPEARINVAFANTDEFSRDFNCPIGSRMNPTHKCRFEKSKSSLYSDGSYTNDL